MYFQYNWIYVGSGSYESFHRASNMPKTLTAARVFGQIVVDLGDYFSLPSPSGSEPESLAAQCDSSDYDMAHLPVLSA